MDTDDRRRVPVHADLETGVLYVDAFVHTVDPHETVIAFLEQVSSDDLEERMINYQHDGVSVGKAVLEALKELAR